MATNEEKFIIVYEGTVLGPFDTYRQALKAGYEKFGLVLFDVRKLSRAVLIEYFPRDLTQGPAAENQNER